MRDVAQLNYFNPDTREAMIGVLAAIAEHCDGVRCDMAMLVLNDVFAQTWSQRVDLLWGAPADEFWPGATRRAPMTYLAEVYWDREYQLQQQGFDFTYDKRLLDRLHHGDPHETRGHLHADPAYSRKLARFLENHDEARSVPTFGHRLRAAAALTFTLPGLRFFFDGQFAGADLRAPVQLGRWPPDPDRADVRDLYARFWRRSTPRSFTTASGHCYPCAARAIRRTAISSRTRGGAATTSPSSPPTSRAMSRRGSSTSASCRPATHSR